ncbi:MAG: glyoxalase [Pseudopedobacter saltans]|uniref:Glyoxalase n=1 Tax=Pseudopedobacter saltans TaxID=151895 RepID=A0A2W5GE57_9SPHI|nr:MAG: glyoxalase [Pseudopedobacter saltans]
MAQNTISDTNNYQKTEVRGIDHVGITVPDIEAATKYLEEAFGATFLYDNITPNDPPQTGLGAEAKLGIAHGAAVTRIRMIRIANGANIELFEMKVPDGERKMKTIPSDYGLQHVAFYSDDIDATRERVIKAGGKVLTGPTIMHGKEEGNGNKFLYTIAPWGTFFEVISLPSPLKIDETNKVHRWKAKDTLL